MKHLLLAATAVAGIGLAAAPARADTLYNWSVSSDNLGTSFTSSGTFSLGAGSLITAWTGTWAGATISGLSVPGSTGGNDNLYPLNGHGVTFGVSPALYGGSLEVNLFSGGVVVGFLWGGDAFDANTNPMTFTAAPATAAVPEPASMALLGAGLLGLGALRRRAR